MSLTTFIKQKTIATALQRMHSHAPTRRFTELKIPPRSTDYVLLGTAFDYLFRFELKRRCPNAVARRWIADEAIQYFPRGKDLKRVLKILAIAREFLAAWHQNSKNDPKLFSTAAHYALELACLDPVYRTGDYRNYVRSSRNRSDNVADLVDLITAVPFDAFAKSDPLLLNPNFGDASALVGGADADIIAGNTIVDIKVTKNPGPQSPHLSQLLGYLFLVRHARKLGCKCRESTFRALDSVNDILDLIERGFEVTPCDDEFNDHIIEKKVCFFPHIHRLAIYSARHAELWTWDVTDLQTTPDFLQAEAEFLAKANWQQERRRQVLNQLLGRKTAVKNPRALRSEKSGSPDAPFARLPKK